MNWLIWPPKTISLYSPQSDRVFLVIDDFNLKLPMTKDRQGYWRIRTNLSRKKYEKLSYYFDVYKDGHAAKIIDPTAKRLKIVGGRYKAYFNGLRNYYRNWLYHAPSFSKIVIYESHLPALSRHSSAVLSDASHRGTYLGATSDYVVKHLQKLNVAVEFLPLHFHDKALGQDWGYYSVNYHAMRTDFAVDADVVNHEVMKLIETYHDHKIPVLLDVVFNHGAELWVKAWGQAIVYRKLEKGIFCNGSGCGPSVNTEHLHIRKMIIDSLLYMVKHYRFDGFRFDLAALHDKETMLEIDRQLPKRIYLIAEPWALSGTQWYKQDMSTLFSDTRWSVWNDDFRESGRTFVTGQGDFHNRDILMRSITGSHINDGGWAVRPQQSINYLSCHDGKTLADLVGGDKNRAFLGIFIVLTSQGIPMLGEGSEMLYSKQGHDNSYDRPDLNQLDWNSAKLNSDLVNAVASLVRLRKHFSHFNYTGYLKANDHKSDDWNIDWIYPTGYPHNDNVNAIGYLLRRPKRYFLPHSGHQPLLILLNGSHSGVDFQLPEGKWKVLVDGFFLLVDLKGISTTPAAEDNYHLHPGTCALLAPK
jgi:pullulanase